MCVESQIPITQRFLYFDTPEESGVHMEFRLIYRGPLPSESGSETRRPIKNKIRSVLHLQLKELWQREFLGGQGGMMAFTSHPDFEEERTLDDLAENYKIANKNNDIYRFVPLISERYGISCSLNILFMRRDNPGGIVRHGGEHRQPIKGSV
jgi:hypothetical protein